MSRIVIVAMLSFFILSCYENREKCACNKEIIQDSITKLHVNSESVKIDSLKESTFYALSEVESRVLWFSEIENPNRTEYTKLWLSSSDIYHTSQKDFVKYYNNRTDIELAFQLGPHGVMWSYHLFIVKKIGCCYLITRTDNTHNRIHSKRYAILNQDEFKKLNNIINTQKTSPLDTVFTFSYCGYFIDNKNKKRFYIDFEQIGNDTLQIRKKNNEESLEQFFNFIEKDIQWVETYSLL